MLRHAGRSIKRWWRRAANAASSYRCRGGKYACCPRPCNGTRGAGTRGGPVVYDFERTRAAAGAVQRLATSQSRLAEDKAMDEQGSAVLNPQGRLEAKAAPRAAVAAGGAHRVVIGLIDNSKPNVAYFLDA